MDKINIYLKRSKIIKQTPYTIIPTMNNVIHTHIYIYIYEHFFENSK